MSRQARAEPTIGPTRPARSRTTSVLSPAAAPAVPASNALNKKIVKRVVIANLRETEVILDRSAHIVASPKRRFYRRVTKVLESMLICDAIAKIAVATFRTARSSPLVTRLARTPRLGCPYALGKH